MSNQPYKPIFYPSNYYYGSNVIIIAWSGNQVEDYTTHSFIELHQDADHAIILNRMSVSYIIHAIIAAVLLWKVHIQKYLSSNSTDVETRCMYKSVKNTKAMRSYTEALSLHTVHHQYIGKITQVVCMLFNIK